MINDIVIGFHGAFGRIDRGEIDAVTVIAMNQIVMHMEIELVEAGGVAGATARRAKWR